MDLAEDELSDLPLLDSDRDLDLDFFKPRETDLDFDLLRLLLGDFDFLLLGRGDRCLRDKERDFERLPDLGGERYLRPGDRERLLTGERDLDRRRDGGLLDLVRLRGLLDLDRRLRLTTAVDRE